MFILILFNFLEIGILNKLIPICFIHLIILILKFIRIINFLILHNIVFHRICFSIIMEGYLLLILVIIISLLIIILSIFFICLISHVLLLLQIVMLNLILILINML
jgi:hypothetical protein